MADYSVRALVVDDSYAMGSIVAGFLSAIGFTNVDRALDGSLALAALRSRAYGLIVCDYVMSPMSGPELRAEMEKSEDLRGIPFLLMTAHAPTSPLKAKYPDLSDFALKPFSMDTLREKVDRLLDAKARLTAMESVGGMLVWTITCFIDRMRR